MDNRALVILGSGYTGRFLAPRALRQYPYVFVTSRSPEQHLPDVPAQQRIEFDLERSATWAHIPPAADLLWCFPATPLELVHQFAEAIKAPSRRIVLLGSTSAYDVGDSHNYPPAWLDESAPIDRSKSRVQGEEFLRTQCHAIVLRVAGIYGPGRNPLDWIKNGRVGPSRKYVNLIHVDDLVVTCLAALERGKPGETYNVSDGHPHTWEVICSTAHERWNVPLRTESQADASGKRINTHKLTTELGVRVQHFDLFTALEGLER